MPSFGFDAGFSLKRGRGIGQTVLRLINIRDIGEPRATGTPAGDADDHQSVSIHWASLKNCPVPVRLIGEIGQRGSKGNPKNALLGVANYMEQDYNRNPSLFPSYLTPAYLRSIIKLGNTSAQPSGFPTGGIASEGSDLVRDAINASSASSPLMIIDYGGAGVSAQAFYECDKSKLPYVIYYGVQPFNNSPTGSGNTNWSEDQYANAWIEAQQQAGGVLENMAVAIFDQTTLRGRYLTQTANTFTTQPIADYNAQNHGALGDYFYGSGRDPTESGRVDGIRMSDGCWLWLWGRANPTVTDLFTNPGADTWAGKFYAHATIPNRWVDSTVTAERIVMDSGTIFNGAKTSQAHIPDVKAMATALFATFGTQPHAATPGQIYQQYALPNGAGIYDTATATSVTGTAQVGQTLTATAPALNNSPTSTEYMWATSADSGATYTTVGASSTYVPVSTDTLYAFSRGVNASGAGPWYRSGAITVAAEGGYDADAAAYFAAMTVQPDTTRKNAINQLFLDIKAIESGAVFNALDGFLITDTCTDEQQQRVIGKSATVATRRVVAGTGPTFNSSDAFNGGGGTSNTGSIDTGMIPSSGSLNFKQNSAFMMIFSTAAQVDVASGVLFGIDNGFISPRNDVGNFTTRLLTSSSQSNIANSTPGGFSWSRVSSTLYRKYRNGVEVANGTTASVAPTSGRPIRLGEGIQGTVSNQSCGIALWGASLTITQHASLHAACVTFLTAIGRNTDYGL